MFFVLIFFILFALPSGLLLSLGSLLAIWLALGQTNIFIRMPLFLAATVPLGVVPCLAEASQGACQMYLFGSLLIAASLPRTSFALQIPTFLSGALFMSCVPHQLSSSNLDSSWIVRVTLAICCVAFVVSMGFRSFANPWVSLFPLTMLVHSGLVIGMLMRARYHGYRLVRVVAKEQLKLEAVNAVP